MVDLLCSIFCLTRAAFANVSRVRRWLLLLLLLKRKVVVVIVLIRGVHVDGDGDGCDG